MTSMHIAPDGYDFIVSGKIDRKTDLVWNDYDKVWERPRRDDFTTLGPMVENGWYAVVRLIEHIKPRCCGSCKHWPAGRKETRLCEFTPERPIVPFAYNMPWPPHKSETYAHGGANCPVWLLK